MDFHITEGRKGPRVPAAAAETLCAQAPLVRGGFTFDHPHPSEAQEIWSLIERIGTLERNTAYAYVLFASYFRSSVIVARRSGRVQGFVLGFRPPERPDTVFVWQVGVAPEARGKGLGRLLLDVLIGAQPPQVRFLEATVTPENAASEALFRGFAARSGGACRVSGGFGPELFPGTGHARERLFRIGPLDRQTARAPEPAE